ncbi:hypothetical protein DRJ17_05565 [Candidatus Woesearchaeota archaeon]|nr:MAG: hypothetical protein DRJ17_05565 [Candidatus Woesearchaeota archaeon]
MTQDKETKGEIFKKYFFAGVLALLPIIIAYLILKYLFDIFKNNIFQYLPSIFKVNPIFDYILYFVFLFGVIMIFGYITIKLFTTKWKSRIDSTIEKIPGFNVIFNPFKQLTESFLTKKKHKFKRVVLIEYPLKGTYAIAFVTKEYVRIGNKSMISVIVPTTPVPMSGYTLYVPRDKVIELDISIEQAVQTIVSGGVIQHRKIKILHQKNKGKEKENKEKEN